MSELNELRDRIAQIDAQLVGLVAERTKLAEKVIAAKLAEGSPIRDEEQEEEVLSRAVLLAVENGLDPALTKDLFRVLISMSVERQREFMGEGNLP
ncbi:MAG: chorismate mutase [Methermicoccaceae archaeon]